MKNDKCISDRILNYLELYLDKLWNGYEVVVQEKEIGCEDEPPYKEIVLKEEKREHREGPLRFLMSDKVYEVFRTDVIEYYNNNIRGEMEYTNQNPISIAGIIIFKFLKLSPGIVFRTAHGSFLTYVISTSILEQEVIHHTGFGMKMKRIKLPDIGHYFEEKYGPLPQFQYGKGGQVGKKWDISYMVKKN